MIFLQQYTTTDHCPFNVFCTSEKTLSSIFSNRTLTSNRRSPQMPSLLQDKQSQSLLSSQLCHILQPLHPPGSCPLDWLHFVSLYFWEEAKPGIVLSTHMCWRGGNSPFPQPSSYILANTASYMINFDCHKIMQLLLQIHLHKHQYCCTYRFIPSQPGHFTRLTRFPPIHSPTLLRSPWVAALCKSYEDTFSSAIH